MLKPVFWDKPLKYNWDRQTDRQTDIEILLNYVLENVSCNLCLKISERKFNRYIKKDKYERYKSH